MFDESMITPKILSYKNAEIVRQEALKLAHRLDTEQLRLLPAAIADCYTNEPADTLNSEVYSIQGAAIEYLLEESLQNGRSRPNFLSRNGNYRVCIKILTTPPRVKKKR